MYSEKIIKSDLSLHISKFDSGTMMFIKSRLLTTIPNISITGSRFIENEPVH